MNDVYNEYRVTSVVATSDADVGSVFAYSYIARRANRF